MAHGSAGLKKHSLILRSAFLLELLPVQVTAAVGPVEIYRALIATQTGEPVPYVEMKLKNKPNHDQAQKRHCN